MVCRCLLRGLTNMSIEFENDTVDDSGTLDDSITQHMSEQTLLSTGIRAVSYTHLTLPTNREV